MTDWGEGSQPRQPEIRPVSRSPLAAAGDLTYIAGIFHMGDLEEAGSEAGTGAEDVWRNQVWPTQRN